jgi:hypothetical protein
LDTIIFSVGTGAPALGFAFAGTGATGADLLPMMFAFAVPRRGVRLVRRFDEMI